ncbi:hypothetical protein FACS1894179_03090 [Bacteroidia bacterium]|nr:hypothetical protein FACS1894179_03090 [Bacteroidia bacterium]
MNTINIKAEKQTKDKGKAKLIIIFHKTGFCRAKKILEITEYFKDYLFSCISQSSVLKGSAGNPPLLNRLTSGLFDHE